MYINRGCLQREIPLATPAAPKKLLSLLNISRNKLMILILVTSIALPFFTVQITDPRVNKSPEKVDPSMKTALINTAGGLKLDSQEEIFVNE